MDTNIKVAVRVRPYNRKEMEQNQQCIINVADRTTLIFDPENEDDEFFYQGVKQTYRDITKRTNKKLSMEFDRVFDTEATNMEIFNECTSPLVDAVLNGYNCSVFVYGATGAGKTFTMLGNTVNPGLTFLTMQDLFNKMLTRKQKVKFDVGVSYLEVYNEQVMNLLTKSGPLKLREDSEKGVVVSGLVLKPIFSAEELLQLLTLGNSNRTQHPTDANAESSRSHAVFQVHIRMTDIKTGTKCTVKLSMIDLAGSERAASTKGMGLRFKEGASINKSLLALGNCINKLADGQKHIPYRDSNLTRLLKDSLGGNCRTLMVANVSMSSVTYEDTYNTLKYASRAKKIRSTLRQNIMKTNMPKDFYIKKVTDVMADNERLQELVKSLETKLAQSENIASNPSSSNDHELRQWHKKIDGVYAALISAQEQVLDNQCKIKVLTLHKHLQKEAECCKEYLTQSNPVDWRKEIGIIDLTYTSKIEAKNLERIPKRSKYQECQRNLDCLKSEINNSKYARELQLYLHSKDLEVRISKKTIYTNFAGFVYEEQKKEMNKTRPLFRRACRLLQSTSAAFTNEQRELYDSIVNDLNNAKSISAQLKRTNDVDIDILINGKNAVSSSQNCMSPHSTSTAKKFRLDQLNDDEVDKLSLDTSDDDDLEFKVPTIKANNLNATHVIPNTELNATFDCHVKAESVLKSDLINGILSDQVAHVATNKDQLKNVLLKSKTFHRQGLLKTVTAGVQKENKKFSPGKIRKSPRALPTKALTTSTNNIRKQIVRNLNGNSSGEPVVRINRAASFRYKK